MGKVEPLDYGVGISSGGMVYGGELGVPQAAEISKVEQLMNEFEAHESGEKQFTQRYKEIAEKTENPFIQFLLRLIISDEEKHYVLTHAMASTLKGSLNWTRPQEVVRGLYNLGEEKEDLLKLTEDFVRLEKEGIKEYKKLKKECEGYYHGLFVLLLQAMIRDSEKHVEILEFLRKTVKEA